MNEEPVAVAHSVFSAEALIREVTRRLDIGIPERAQFLHRGQNDTYLAHTSSGRFIVRVYRNGLRTVADVGYELRVIEHLAACSIPVARPLADDAGEFVQTIAAPEGPRFAVTFTFAPGPQASFYLPTIEQARAAEQARRFGRAAALMHSALDSFSSTAQRRTIDRAFLVDRPLEILSGVASAGDANWAYIKALVPRIAAAIDRYGNSLDWGACHGDLHGFNAAFATDGTITFYDFDECGPGWRAWDLAALRRTLEREVPGRAEELWQAFLKGYRDCRQFSAANEASVPLFVMLHQVWAMRSLAEQGPCQGHGMLNNRWFAYCRWLLERWERQYLPDGT